MEKKGVRREIIKTRAGYLASYAGVGIIIIGVIALFAFDLFDTFFGVLVMATLFFAGITIPYIIDSMVGGIQSRRRHDEKPDN